MTTFFGVTTERLCAIAERHQVEMRAAEEQALNVVARDDDVSVQEHISFIVWRAAAQLEAACDLVGIDPSLVTAAFASTRGARQ